MKKLLFIVIFSALLMGTCSAELDYEKELYGAIPQYAEDAAGKASDDLQTRLGKIVSEFETSLSSGFGSAVKRALAIAAVGAVCSVLSSLEANGRGDLTSLGGACAIALISIGDVNSFIETGRNVIDVLSGFSKVLLPAMCAASAACGTLGAASAKYAATVLFMDVFVTMAQTVILPLIYAYLALSIAAAAFDNEHLGGASRLLKRVCVFLMTACALAFTAYISISSTIASGGDAVASKLAKTTISTVLPVVGGIISDAASTVVAGAQTVRNSIGVFGMMALLAICASPFAVLVVNYVCYKAASAAVSALGNKRLSTLTGGIGSAIGMILGLAGCCAIILFISMTVSIKAVSG